MKGVTLITYFVSFIFVSCQKGYLDKKPNESLVVPSTLTDLQAILDNDRFMNGSGIYNLSGPNPAFLEVGTDNLYVDSADYVNLVQAAKNVYVWNQNDVYAGVLNLADWVSPYRAVFYANIALDGLPKIEITSANQDAYNNIKGSALFYRAFAFYQLVQAFAPVYSKSNAETSLGIPLRLESDVSALTNRSSLQQTYDQIAADLYTALSLLPATPLFKTRPSKSAVYALLARMYLSMQDYEKALINAEACLNITNKLLSYKDLPTGGTPFARFNDEVIFHSITTATDFRFLYHSSRARVDSVLYKSYKSNDLRKTLFFTQVQPNKYGFRGSYDASVYPFMGFATDEMYLIQAECYARTGDYTRAINDLNILLSKRYDNTFVPYTANDATDALAQIKTERRKELIFRGLRWTDLRRYNLEGDNIAITRKVNGQLITLPPNDLRWVWPIPDDVIGFNPQMEQNPR